MTRRDNGIPGGEWQRVADLAPPLADHVLDVLRDEGIAAYAAPVADLTGPYLEARPQPRPQDRVYVGRAQVERARQVLDRLLPELRAELDRERPPDLAASVSTDDDVWAGIVASYAAPPADPVGRWSAAEEVDPDGAARARADAADAPAAAAEPADTTMAAPGPATGFDDITAELDELDARAQSRAAGPADDPTDHYVPPPPPPLPEVDTVTRMAWVGILGGPTFLILATLLGWGPGGFTGLVAVLAFVGGFVTLVTRMGDDPPSDDDDGAVV